MHVSVEEWFPSLVLVVGLTGCSQPPAKLSYHKVAEGVNGYTFVVPRTVVNVVVTTRAKAAAPEPASGTNPRQEAKPPVPNTEDLVLTLSIAPEVHDRNGGMLPVFSVTDDSAALFSLTPTTVTSVTYVAPYIIKTLGTQVTDNRAKAIDASIATLGLVGKIAGVGFAGEQQPDCTKTNTVPAFTIDSFEQPIPSGNFVPTSKCWGYKVDITAKEGAPDVYPLSENGNLTIPLENRVAWFPYPACRTVLITVYQCDVNDTNTCTEKQNGTSITGSTSVSTGEFYRRMTLPGKGQISMHPDLCTADATNDASEYTSGWALLQSAISDYQGLSGAGKNATKSNSSGGTQGKAQ